MQRYWFTTLLYICSTGPSYDVPILHPLACQHHPSSLKMFLCVSGISTKLGVWGPNRCWDIEFPTPTCICSTWPRFGLLMLCPWVCQHLSSGIKCSYASQKPPKKFGAWGPNRCWDIESPTPPCICLTWPRYGHWYSACGCATTSQVIWNVPMCLRNLQKTWCMRP